MGRLTVPFIALAFLAGAVSAWIFRADMADAEISALMASHIDKIARAQQQARKQEQAVHATYEGALNAARTREAELRATTAVLRSERDRLRDSLRTAGERLPTAPASAVIEYATTVNELFGECSRSYIELAQAADGHAADVRTLIQAWPMIAD